MSENIRASAVVLAGRRNGSVDPLAEAHGVADKCLVPVLGTPCIEHVLQALAAAPQIDRIIVSINDPAILAGLPTADRLVAEGLIQSRRDSRNVFYSADPAGLGGVLSYLLNDCCMDHPEVIATRMANARIEVAQARAFDFVIINALFETALFDLKAIVHAQRLKYSAQRRAKSAVFAALNLS